MNIVFGPVPSRRLGLSLGVNNIPPKHCSYSCIYCQIGRTPFYTIDRKAFIDPEKIINGVVNYYKALKTFPDYITFVPDGEPTLDINLGYVARKLKEKIPETPLAVITNSSLIYREDVKEELMNFDLVSLKVDAVSESVWRTINRPHPKLRLGDILDGIVSFTKVFRGTVLTETMLVENINDSKDELENIGGFLAKIRLGKAYIAVPVRPPAESWVRAPNETTVTYAYHIFTKYLGESKVELLIRYEGEKFEIVGDPISALLSIISVHPLRIDYAKNMLEKKGISSEITIEKLIKEGKIVKIKYGDHEFLLRKFKLSK